MTEVPTVGPQNEKDSVDSLDLEAVRSNTLIQLQDEYKAVRDASDGTNMLSKMRPIDRKALDLVGQFTKAEQFNRAIDVLSEYARAVPETWIDVAEVFKRIHRQALECSPSEADKIVQWMLGGLDTNSSTANFRLRAVLTAMLNHDHMGNIVSYYHGKDELGTARNIVKFSEEWKQYWENQRTVK